MSQVDFRLEDCYTILGLSIKDKHLYDEKHIKSAFRKMALKYHPDKNKEPLAARQFKLIFLSYQEVLGDMDINDSKATKRKSKYDYIYSAEGYNVASFRAGWIKHAALFEDDMHSGKMFGNERPVGHITNMGWSYFDEFGRFHGHPYGKRHNSNTGVTLDQLKDIIG